ncbi:MAG TPA: thioredoxin family protein [Candidatus Nanoarchaeia archaeon]|nr:thioredoxin family protein [Candidatus Nanoarchaeia archaeon]
MVLLASEYQILKSGETAPAFKLPATDGKTNPLQEIKGSNITLIIFMCNHCPYVLPKIKEIKKIAVDFKNKGLVVIGINPNESLNYPEDSFAKMKEYFEKWKIPFFYLRDETQEVAKAYGAVCTPDPFLFDSNLKLIYHGRITDFHGKEGGNPELYEVIEEFLRSGKITRAEKPSMGCSIKWKE